MAFTAIRFETWNAMFDFGRGLTNWFYRGQSDATWSLTSSLERAIGVDHGDSWRWDHTEKWMLRKFRGFAHNYLAHPPHEDDMLEWLALMQHHGAPTRLLDCTHSFPVSVFFAARDATGDFAVWAFNWAQFFRKAISRFSLDVDGQFATLEFNAEMHQKANEFLERSASGALVFPSMPLRSNQRMEAQQGLFLFPTDPARTFLENLGCLIDAADIEQIDNPAHLKAYDPKVHSVNMVRQLWMMKLVLPEKQRFHAIQGLRSMNIHEASLFPGLDGFARSLTQYTIRDDG